MSMQDKKYLKFAKEQGLVETDTVENRRFPELDGIEDFTHISKNALLLDGYSPKWAGRVDRSKLEELIYEIQNNPKCSYETCYTKDAFEGYVPKYFSAIIKHLEYDSEVDADVFGSRVLNFFEIPTVFNLRIDGIGESVDKFCSDNSYLISVDFIRENEEFYDLYDVYSGMSFDIQYVFENGLERTINVNSKLLKIFLKNNQIDFTEKDIENFKSVLAKSIIARTIVLGDKDFRNANSGILLNKKEKTFRPAPNHDFNFILKFDKINGEGLRVVDEYSKLYPEDYADLFDKLLEFTAKSGKHLSQLELTAKDCFKDDYDRQKAVSIVFNNIRQIADFEMEKLSQIEK